MTARRVVDDHGELEGLADDDHIQYLLIDGSRDMTGNQKMVHISVGGAAPTTGHLIIGNEFYTGSANKVGIGMFPAYIPSSLAANNLYGVQGNVFFGGSNWAALSTVNALQFYPAPDYLNGAVSWGSTNLNLIGITTGGLINIFTRTVTAATLIGISVTTLAAIFGGPGAVTTPIATAVQVTTPAVTTGTIGVQTGISVDPQLGGTVNQGIWIAGDNSVVVPPLGGANLVFGAGKDANLYFNGTDFVIDPDFAGSGIVLIGATGDDDMRLNDIEIDGALNHDGTTVGFFNTAPITKPTVIGAKAGNVALGNLLTALANTGLLTDSTT